MIIHSVTDIAALTGYHIRKVRRHCRALDMPKVGDTYIILDTDLDRLMESMQSARPGNPNWRKS